MRKKFLPWLLLLILILLVAAVPFAPDIAINWWAIGAGSKTVSSGSLSLEGMLGQPAAGQLFSSQTELNVGYLQPWILIVTWVSNYLPLIMR